ncbi:MAG: hypothetical protein J6A82_01275 [Coprococcus sp.]|nr:hypothetical protein [Coprococcus sp.]
MDTLRFEMNRAFRNKGLYISIGIGSAIGILDLVLFYSMYETDGRTSLTQAWIGTNYQFAYNTLYYIMLPAIACIPYAGSYFADMNSGYDKNILIKTSRGSYIRAKLVAVFTSAFVAVVTPLLLDLFLAAGLYPDNKPERLSFMVAGIVDSQLWAELYGTHPVLYSLLFTGIDGLFGGLFGVMSVCVGRWMNSNFTAVMVPFALYVVSGEVLVSNKKRMLSIMLMINPVQRAGAICWYNMLSLYIVLMLVCLFVTWFNSRRRDVL